MNYIFFSAGDAIYPDTSSLRDSQGWGQSEPPVSGGGRPQPQDILDIKQVRYCSISVNMCLLMRLFCRLGRLDRRGQNYKILKNGSLEFASLEKGDEGGYKCKAKNMYGEVTMLRQLDNEQDEVF